MLQRLQLTLSILLFIAVVMLGHRAIHLNNEVINLKVENDQLRQQTHGHIVVIPK